MGEPREGDREEKNPEHSECSGPVRGRGRDPYLKRKRVPPSGENTTPKDLEARVDWKTFKREEKKLRSFGIQRGNTTQHGRKKRSSCGLLHYGATRPGSQRLLY